MIIFHQVIDVRQVQIETLKAGKVLAQEHI
jgi:hypothetical protein